MADSPKSPKSPKVEYVRVVYVGDPNELLTAMSSWHRDRIQELVELRDTCHEGEIVVDNGPNIPMTGDFLKGFQMGVATALMHVGTLPYVHSGLNGANDAELSSTPYKLQTHH